MDATDVIGWGSSAILVLTLGEQVKKQWKSGSTEGVSRWLFVGQLVASIGFSVYSILLKNWVFVVTNLLLVVNAILGGLIILHNRRKGGKDGGSKGDDGKGDDGSDHPSDGTPSQPRDHSTKAA